MGIRYGKKGHDIEERAKKAATDDPDFQKLFDDYCESITELSRASLAEYVVHRKLSLIYLSVLSKRVQMENIAWSHEFIVLYALCRQRLMIQRWII